MAHSPEQAALVRAKRQAELEKRARAAGQPIPSVEQVEFLEDLAKRHEALKKQLQPKPVVPPTPKK